VITAIACTACFLATYGALLLLAVTAGGIAYLWHLGRRHVEPPAWIAPPATTDARDVVRDGREPGAGAVLEGWPLDRP
jgi:hypothetical protein